MKRVLALCGSLRATSSNAAVLGASALLAPVGVMIERIPSLDALPFFNPDRDQAPWPSPVADLRRRIGEASGLIICSPEYARGIAGVLKNALDWLVSSSEFPDKPVAVINASQRALHADAALRLTLITMSARLIEPASITLPLLGRRLDAAGIVADAELGALLRRALEALAAAL